MLHGGLSHDPTGKTEPYTLGGCVGNAPCVGEVFLFDTLAEGWESLSIKAPSVSSYPAARAGHSMASVGPSVSPMRLIMQRQRLSTHVLSRHLHSLH